MAGEHHEKDVYQKIKNQDPTCLDFMYNIPVSSQTGLPYLTLRRLPDISSPFLSTQKQYDMSHCTRSKLPSGLHCGIIA